MININHIEKELRDEALLQELNRIWESAVQATHSFLKPSDIEDLKPDVNRAIKQIQHLYCYFDENDQLLAFMGTEGNKLEMLFVDATVRGRGIGKELVQYAIRNLDIKYVDVNEANIQGCGFYKHLGFEVIGRSDLDADGRPFPILHLQMV